MNNNTSIRINDELEEQIERAARDHDYEWQNGQIDKAIHYATDKHSSQLRKGTEIPYITHPLEVYTILSAMGADTNLRIAGLLHDVLEDTDATLNDIIWNFGYDVGELVTAHTEDKSLPWKERKGHAIEELRKADLRVKLLVFADKLSNLRSMYNDYYMIGDKLWERFNASKENQSWYYSKSQDALEDLQFYEESRGFYWEFVDKFKDVFVRFYFYEFEEAVYMISLDGEGYMFTSRETEAVPFTGEIPADAAQITRKYAERLQDNWLEGDFYMNQGMFN